MKLILLWKWILEHFRKFDSWILKDLEHHTASPTNVCITFEKKEYAIKCQWYLFAMSLLAAPFIWKHCAPTSRKDRNNYWRRLHNFFSHCVGCRGNCYSDFFHALKSGYVTCKSQKRRWHKKLSLYIYVNCSWYLMSYYIAKSIWMYILCNLIGIVVWLTWNVRTFDFVNW